MAKKTERPTKSQTAETGKLEFLGLRLIESGAKLGQLKANELPGHATQAINVKVGTNDKMKSAAVNVSITLAVSYDEDETKEPVLSILASFVANFSIEKAFSSKEAIDKLLEQVGMLIIWPYWREYVQSMTTRMGLPAFPVPLVKMNELIQDDKSSQTTKKD